jgi:hypothetical protein
MQTKTPQRKWNLHRQARLASENVKQWPQWMRDAAHFVGTETPALRRQQK